MIEYGNWEKARIFQFADPKSHHYRGQGSAVPRHTKSHTWNIHLQVQPVNSITQSGCTALIQTQTAPAALFHSVLWQFRMKVFCSIPRLFLYPVSPQLPASCRESYTGLQVNVHGCTHTPTYTYTLTHTHRALNSPVSSCLMRAHTHANMFLGWPNSPSTIWLRPTGPSSSQFAGCLFSSFSGLAQT